MTILPEALSVYVITSGGLVPGRGHFDVAVAAVEGGARAVQLRAPELTDEELLPLARDLAKGCRAADVLLVVNDRVDVAIESGAAGVHLGQRDDLAGARERLGPGRVLGISVDTPEQGRAAEAAGADYLGVTVFATPTKPGAVPVGLDGLREVVRATRLPVVGVGGIHEGNVREVLAAGAAGVAVVSAVGAAEDPAEVTRRIARSVKRFLNGGER